MVKFITRIKYKKGLNGILFTPEFETPNGKVGVNISPRGFFVICDDKGNLISVGPDSISIAKAKKLVRKELKRLGVKLQDEVKPRLKGIEK